jgi:hypothetical protein
VGAADTDGERRRRFGKRWDCPVYADAETMLKETSPNILHIATHPDSRRRYRVLAANRGSPRGGLREAPDGTHLADALMYLSGLCLWRRRSWGAPLSGKTRSAPGKGPPPPGTVPVLPWQ